MSTATHRSPLAIVALATIIAGSTPAFAQAEASASLPVGETDTQGLIVVLQGAGSLPGGGSARVGLHATDGELLTALVDDGQGVDAVAADGIFTAQVPGSLAKGAAVRLLDAEDTVLWQDWLQVDDEVLQPRISFTVDGTQVQAEVLTQASAKRQSQGGQLVAPPPPTQNVTGLMVVMMLACLALGLVLGINVGPSLMRRLRRRQQTVLSTNTAAVSLPAGVPPSSRPRLWSCPDDETRGQITMLLAEHLAQQHAVLVVLSPERLAACRAQLERLPVTMVPATAHPSVARLLAAWREGGSGRPPVVIVEGAEALEETLQDEPRDAVVEELLDVAPSDAPILVLLSAHELDLLRNRVDLALRTLPGGLGPEGGPVVLTDPPDGLHFADPSAPDAPAT